jgi:hypothetical protein
MSYVCLQGPNSPAAESPVADPSPEVVAAALALADAYTALSIAVDSGEPVPEGLLEAKNRAAHTYRAAIAPKLRTRAEVALDLAEAICFSERRTVGRDVSLVAGDTGKVSDLITEYGRAKAREETAPEPNTFTTRHGDTIDLGTEDPCGCEASDALRDEVKELRKLLDFARRQLEDTLTILKEGRA